jgi:hypothetical protein
VQPPSASVSISEVTEQIGSPWIRRHRHVEFIAFRNSLTRRYPGRDLRVAPDLQQLGDPQASGGKAAIAAHPRFHLHLTPTGATCLNLVERWFALIADSPIRRGSFENVRRLARGIMRRLALESAGSALPLDQVNRAG